VSTAVTLPGGLVRDGRLVRAAVFRELTGRLEQRLAAPADHPPAVRVSELLVAALARIGSELPTRALIEELSVGDRQFLMLALALQFDAGPQWRQLRCVHCEALSDVGYELSELPMSSAGAGYPCSDVQVADQCLRVRVPNGADEIAIAGLDVRRARARLATRCVIAVDGVPRMPDEPLAISAEQIDAIDAALDDLMPQVATALSTTCTQCEAALQLDIDPYAAVSPRLGDLYAEVHALALRYHWSEAQCLRLPRERRRLYLQLIDQSLGAHH